MAKLQNHTIVIKNMQVWMMPKHDNILFSQHILDLHSTLFIGLNFSLRLNPQFRYLILHRTNGGVKSNS